MALLSKVTVVVTPSQQLDTPAPMTGDPLDVIERSEFLDPPELVNNNATVWFSIVNPQRFLPFPEVNDSTPPPTIFRNNQYQKPREPSNRRPLRNVYLPAIASQAATIIYNGQERINEMTMPQGTGGNPVDSIAPNVLNGRDLEIVDFLTYNYNSGETFYSNASGTSENEVNSEGPTMGPSKIAHSWVMCGKAYTLMSTGEIYRSMDAFTTDVEEQGKIYVENASISRNHPGALIDESQPYT